MAKLPSWLSGLPHTAATSLEVCQAVPGYILASDHPETAQEILVALASHAKGGFVVEKITRGTPDLEATLWFALAAYLARPVIDSPTPSAHWRECMLPLIKKAAQEMISGSADDMRMDDGGMLAPAAGGSVCPMGINALWYFVMSLLAEELHEIRDPVGDHFERLAGRFRRSFSKSFWCPAHGFLCDPEDQKDPAHAAATVLPDPMQLLVATLPFSPIPRTKQRQLVLAVKERGLAPRGVMLPKTSRESGMRGRELPDRIAGAVHLAWLVEAFVKTSDTPVPAAEEARAWIAANAVDAEAGGRGVARFYVDEAVADVSQNPMPHGPSTAETIRVRKMVGL